MEVALNHSCKECAVSVVYDTGESDLLTALGDGLCSDSFGMVKCHGIAVVVIESESRSIVMGLAE